MVIVPLPREIKDRVAFPSSFVIPGIEIVKSRDKVDVNEQNEKALQFYLHLGFQVIGRDETDSMGKPFPILHLQLPEADSTNRD